MAHPRMYRENDPYLPELREICLALPEATEIEAWGRPTFRAGKMFAIFTGSIEERFTVIFKPDPDEQPALIAEERFHIPAYFGSAWLGLDLAAEPVDWVEVAELMETSYRQIALKRMLKALDERSVGEVD